MRTLSYRAALLEAQHQALEADQRVFVMGLGVDDPTGIFGSTLGLAEAFGRERVFDTPLAENGMTGIAIGAALAGMRPIMVHQRVDFLLLTMDQLVNHASKWHYMFGGRQTVPLVVRAVVGRGWGQGAQHSQSLQAMFMHTPGLKVVMPSTAYDAKGLLLASIADHNPVVFIEHRMLYDHTDVVPSEPYEVALGEAAVRRPGRDVTIVGISYMAFEASRAGEALEQQGYDPEIIDLRTVKPWDEATIVESVRKTGRLVIADTSWRTAGAAAEISARVCELAFNDLRAPIERVSLPDVPTPTTHVLEKAFYPGADQIVAAAKRTMGAGREASKAVVGIVEDPAISRFQGPF
jgi:pyruvate/2-oxoglutarate/acetoin dehydrogenase E1 component